MEFERKNRENTIDTSEITLNTFKISPSHSRSCFKKHNSIKNNENKPILKIKISAFSEYLNLGLLPQSFTKLIKMISIQVYPKNFSLNYYSEDFETISIDSRATYKNLFKYCLEENLAEIKLFVIIHENYNQENLTEEFNNLKINTYNHNYEYIYSRKSSMEDSPTREQDYSRNNSFAESDRTFFIKENVNKNEVALKHSRLHCSNCIHCY
jgi:hypothetical protein